MNKKKPHKENSFSLSDQPMASGFGVPSNYFESVEDQFSARLFEEQLPKQSGFTVDKEYFDGLEDQILSKVSTKGKVKKLSFTTRVVKWIPYAAAACVLLFVGFNQFYNENKSLSDVEVETWFEANIDLVSNEDFVTMLDQSDLTDNEFSLATLSDTEILDYLQTTDTSYLINENP